MTLAVFSIAAACVAVWLYKGFLCTIGVAVLLALAYILVFHTRWCYVALMTAKRDLTALLSYINILWITRKFSREDLTIPDIFHNKVLQHPNKPCFLFQDEVWTFHEYGLAEISPMSKLAMFEVPIPLMKTSMVGTSSIANKQALFSSGRPVDVYLVLLRARFETTVEDFSLRVTAALKAQGVKKGNIVGLLMNNCPQLPCLWLGISRLGAVTPLINTNQRGKALVHSVNVAKCDYLICSDDYLSAVQDVRSELNPEIKLFKFTHRPLNTASPSEVSNKDGVVDIIALLENTKPAVWAKANADGFQGKLLYIYTSGTTGLPKAAVISNARFVFMATGIYYLGLRSDDVVYCPLPLYHTAGGIVSVGQALVLGCTVVLKAKFSASQYFPDCAKYNATAAHYIGEMCRYILATPPSPVDKQHKVRVVYGNGLRPQIWTDFVTRFNIKGVIEFYGATEGNANIANTDGTPGAIGFVSRIFPKVYPIAIIKVDQETGEPVRDSQGICQLAEPNEPGAFIGKIQPNNPARQFLGYVDKAASEKKVVRDVFTHGDAAFISGDILVADELGYLYFRDRTGDTFRWRGENVSTTEVEAAVSRVADQRDAVVYGVLVPNIEGRAGMCGIVDVNGTLDLDKLAKDLARDLPAYARPVFLRVMESMDMTGTFKMKKTDLQKEGFDPNLVKKDKLYYLDIKLGKYLPLDKEEYVKIASGKIRL